MSAADSSQTNGRHRRASRGRVRTIEYSRRSVTGEESATPTYARYVGRVGALAVALGIGSGLAAMPMAYATVPRGVVDFGSVAIDA